MNMLLVIIFLSICCFSCSNLLHLDEDCVADSFGTRNATEDLYFTCNGFVNNVTGEYQNFSFWLKPIDSSKEIEIHYYFYSSIFTLGKERFTPNKWNYVFLGIKFDRIATTYFLTLTFDDDKIETRTEIPFKIYNYLILHGFSWSFYGEWEYARNDSYPTVLSPQASRSTRRDVQSGVGYDYIILSVGIVMSITGGICCVIGILTYKKGLNRATGQ